MKLHMRQPQTSRWSRFPGFSLLEVIIVMGIMALAAGLGYPAFRNYRADHAALSAAQLFAADWHAMKERANTITCAAGIRFPNEETYEVFEYDPNVSCTCPGLSGYVSRRKLGFGSLFSVAVRATPTPPLGEYICIQPGLLTGPPLATYSKGDVVFEAMGRRRTATIDTTGDVRVR